MDTVGICDWGIGGLGFYRFLASERPDLNVVYIGDQGATPYGRLPADRLAGRLTAVLRTFHAQGVTHVVVACNAASSVLNRVVMSEVDACGVIAPTLSRLRGETGRAVGIIGGRRTILSGAYARPLRQQGLRVLQRVAQPLSAMIERGEADAPATLSCLKGIVAPLREVDLLVLACTHYVALLPAIQDLLPHATLIDPALETWSVLRVTLLPPTPRRGVHRFYTTGEPCAMQTQAASAFGVYARVDPILLVSE